MHVGNWLGETASHLRKGKPFMGLIVLKDPVHFLVNAEDGEIFPRRFNLGGKKPMI